MGHQVGVFLEAEVVLQNGGDQEGQLGVSGVGCVFEVVLAIAIGVIERLPSVELTKRLAFSMVSK